MHFQDYWAYTLSAGAEDFLQSFEYDDMQFATDYVANPGSPLTSEFLLAAEILMSENNLEFPLTVEEALPFYITLNDLFHAMWIIIISIIIII